MLYKIRSLIFLSLVFFGASQIRCGLKRYRYKCTTDNKIVYEWRESDPTVCIEGAGHTVDWNSLVIVKTKEDDTTIVVNGTGNTQGNYKAESFIVDVTDGLVGSVSFTDYSFPFPVSGLNMILTPGEKNIGDTMCLHISPDTDCGVAAGDANLGRVTSAVSGSDTVISVDAAVLGVVKLGYLVKLKEGETEESLGRCTAIDTTNGTITVETAATQAFNATTTHVLFTIEKVKKVKFYSATPIVLGAYSIGGSEVPANVTGRIIYSNLTGGQKDFGIILEWLE